MKKTSLCPTCKCEAVMHKTNLYRPFCSKRCRLVDLDQWFDETYSISETTNINEKPEVEPGKKH